MVKLKTLIRSVLIAGLISGVGAVSGTGVVSVHAQEAEKTTVPDAARGQALATRLCVNCHVVPDHPAGSVPEGVPSFITIANKPEQTADHIRSILIKPHAPMPDMSLSRAEIDDIIAYLDELRSDTAGPSLLRDQDNPDALPDYPEPT